MARKKKRGRKQPAWKKWVRSIIGIAGAGIGGTIALSPTFRGLQTIASGFPEVGVNEIVNDFTGMDPKGGNFTPDIGRLLGVGVTVGVGIGIISLFRYVARRI